MPNRRDFLKLSAAAIGGFAVGAGALYVATSVHGTSSTTATENLTDLDTLVVGINQSGIDTLDPALSNDGDGSYLPMTNCYETLISWQYPNFFFTEPRLASSVTQGSDGVTWTATLNSSAKFATGDPVTASDVVYSWQRALAVGGGPSGTAGGWFFSMHLTKPDNITAPTSSTVQWVIDEPVQPGLVNSLLTTIAFEIVNQAQLTPNATSTTASGSSTGSSDYGHAWMDNGNSAGTGPYVMAGWDVGTQITLNRNPNYWGTQPAIKQVILKHVATPDSELTLLQSGEIDVAWDLTPTQIQNVSSTPGLTTSESPQAVLYWMWPNCTKAPLNNPATWEAIKWSIDYDGIIDTILNGQAIKVQSLSLEGLEGYNPATPYSKNPAMVSQILSQAGISNLSFQLQISSTNSVAQLIAPKLQSDMSDCGINVTLDSLTDAEIFTNWGNGNFQMLSDWWGGGLQSIMNFIPAWTLPSFGLAADWSGWDDSNVIPLSNQTYTAANDAAADALYSQITNYCLSNAPFVVLWQMVYAIGMSTSVVGVTVPYSRLFIDFSKAYKQSVTGYTPT